MASYDDWYLPLPAPRGGPAPAIPIPIMNWAASQQPAPQQGGGMGTPPLGLLKMIPGLDGGAGGAGSGGLGDMLGGMGGGGLGSFASPMAFAALIGLGKNTEANHPNTPGGDISLGMLGPSAAQIIKDPIGMGLPTLFGVPFITPFTAKPEAKAAKPEWSGLLQGLSDFGF